MERIVGVPSSRPTTEPGGMAVDPLEKREKSGCPSCNCLEEGGTGVERVLVVYAHQLEAGVRCQGRAQSVIGSFGAAVETCS
jgi:hypothetical protein